jgi:hypothetical protein
MAESTNVSSFLDLLGKVATPFVNKYAYGKEKAAELEAYEASLRTRQINGVGALDAAAGASAPAGILGLMFGFTIKDQNGQVRANPIPWILLLVGGIILFLFFRRR